LQLALQNLGDSQGAGETLRCGGRRGLAATECGESEWVSEWVTDAQKQSHRHLRC